MTEKWPAGEVARETHDVFAAAYDDFVGDYMYERWTARLLAKAVEAGAKGNRLLDIGCGTGLSLISMVDRGWQVTGCDVSPLMLEVGRSRVDGCADLVVADMRELPVLGEFDLIWAVNDVFNYLLSIEELEAALGGMRRNLAPGGIALFDVATLATYRSFFSSERVVETEGRSLHWQGQMSSATVLPGSINKARFEASGEPGSAHVHRQRHFTEREVLDSIEAAGLQCVGVHGELDGDLHTDLDEELHTKAVYLCSG